MDGVPPLSLTEPFIGVLSSACPSTSHWFSCAQRTESNSDCAGKFASPFVFCMRLDFVHKRLVIICLSR